MTLNPFHFPVSSMSSPFSSYPSSLLTLPLSCHHLTLNLHPDTSISLIPRIYHEYHPGGELVSSQCTRSHTLRRRDRLVRVGVPALSACRSLPRQSAGSRSSTQRTPPRLRNPKAGASALHQDSTALLAAAEESQPLPDPVSDQSLMMIGKLQSRSSCPIRDSADGPFSALQASGTARLLPNRTFLCLRFK
jgi:hypothetical protein